MFGMVLQDTWLYNGTILENIRYGRLVASDEDVLAAAKAAQVDHFVPVSYTHLDVYKRQGQHQIYFRHAGRA